MFSRPKILFLVSLLFVALLNPKFNPYLLFKFLIFYHSSKILYEDDFPVQIPPYFLKTQYPTRHHHPSHFILPPVNTTQFQQSDFPRSIKDWSTLPTTTTESSSLHMFTCYLNDFNYN